MTNPTLRRQVINIYKGMFALPFHHYTIILPWRAPPVVSVLPAPYLPPSPFPLFLPSPLAPRPLSPNFSSPLPAPPHSFHNPHITKLIEREKTSELLHLGRDYPLGYEVFRARLHGAFSSRARVQDEGEIRRGIERAEFVKKGRLKLSEGGEVR